MNKKELKKILKTEGLLEFCGDDGVKQYVDGDKYYYNGIFHNKADIFGVYQNDDGRYVAFITDTERGYPKYETIKNSEEEACEWLYSIIKSYL